MAKPLNYTKEQKKELFTKICNDVIENKTSFNQAIFNNQLTLTTFYKWLIDDDSLKEIYNYAREIRSDTLFEEIIVIADTTEEGIKIKETSKGTEILKGDMTDHRKLRVDARKWVVSKMNPKKYGDKVEIDHSSKDGSMKPQPTIIVSKPETGEEIKKLYE